MAQAVVDHETHINTATLLWIENSVQFCHRDMLFTMTRHDFVNWVFGVFGLANWAAPNSTLAEPLPVFAQVKFAHCKKRNAEIITNELKQSVGMLLAFKRKTMKNMEIVCKW